MPMFDELAAFHERPEPFSRHTTDLLWTDEHISQRMLALHLDPDSGLASRPPRAIEATIEWMDATLGFSGKSVCDLGCGPGLYAERMAGLGARVTGVDFSSRSISFAREAAKAARLPITYVRADYLSDGLPGGQDLVCLIFCDLCALSPALRAGLYERVRAMLKPGGRFVFDVFSTAQFSQRRGAFACERRLMDGFWAPGDYFGFSSTFLYDERHVALDRYLIVEPERTREIFNWLQYFDPEGTSRELAAAGFTVERIVDALTGEPWRGGPREFAVVARR